MYLKKGKHSMADLNIDVPQQKRPKSLLSEVLRPQSLSDLTLPMPIIHRLQRVIESRSMVNMLFCGPPGSGKTSTARIFINAIGGDTTIDRLSESSSDLAKSIKDLVPRMTTEICFVDQAHFISKRDQTVLPDIIDWGSRHCRFLFATTDITKLLPAKRSRLTEISFEVPPEGREEVQTRVMERYENILSANGCTFDKVRLKGIIEANFPDLHSIANNIEFEFA
jgi:replication-associated recombination protein RarA